MQSESTWASSQTGLGRALNRAASWLSRPRAIWFIALLGVLLTLPSLRVGWVMDDQFHRLVLGRQDRFPQFARAPLDLFRFMDGDVGHTMRIMDAGVVPWWTWPPIRAAFWRPVTAVTHWLDYRFWPDRPWLMHLHSVAWFGLLALLVGVLYRRIEGVAWMAGLAALLYAVDDARGLPVGWLANRNAILAAVFGVGAIIAHDRWRRRRTWPGLLPPLLLLGLSLLSAEAGLATCAYLLAYALFIEQGPRRRRWATLLPYAALVIAWRVVWTLQGYGTRGMGLYADPLGEPVRFAACLLRRFPLLLMGQWALPPSDVNLFLSRFGRGLLWVWAAAVLVSLAWLLVPALRGSRTARFWACGMLLSAIPISATFPSDRLLFFVGLGAMPLLAEFVGAVADRAGLSARRDRALRATAAILLLIHLGVAPVSLAARSAWPSGPPSLTDRLFVRTPLGPEVANQDVVIVNAPSPAHAGYLPVDRALANLPLPRHTRILAPGMLRVAVERLDDRSVAIRPAQGYLLFAFDTLFRNEACPMHVGDRVQLTGMSVEVTSVGPDGRPTEARFRFDVPLESPTLRWLAYRDGEFVPFTPPPVGGSIVLAGMWE